MLDLLAIQTSSQNPSLLPVVFAVVLSFLLSTLIGLTYIKTFKGLSFSRNYVQALILSSIVSSMVMQAIGDSLARGLGMIGALAIIRFRTNFKDPRDILFMFSALAAGISCGVGSFQVAVVGTLCFSFVSFVLSKSSLGRTSYYDGMLRFNMDNNDENRMLLEKILKKHCKKFALITLREMKQGERLDYAYHVKLKRRVDNSDLVRSLPEKVTSVKGVNLMLQETTVEL